MENTIHPSLAPSIKMGHRGPIPLQEVVSPTIGGQGGRFGIQLVGDWVAVCVSLCEQSQSQQRAAID